MAPRKRKEPKEPASAEGIKLAQPDRSGPSEKTLLDFAGKNNLFKQAEIRQRELDQLKRAEAAAAAGNDDTDDSRNSGDDDGDDGDDEDEDDEMDISPRAERTLDTLLWCISLCMLHFTLDVLVQHQFAVAIEWPNVVLRAAFAFPVFSLLFYNLHEHASDPRILPGLPAKAQKPLRQAVFFITSVSAGCYLIHITNAYGYMAVMRHAPPVGCLWVWSVIELDLILAVLSLAVAVAFLKGNGYSF